MRLLPPMRAMLHLQKKSCKGRREGRRAFGPSHSVTHHQQFLLSHARTTSTTATIKQLPRHSQFPKTTQIQKFPNMAITIQDLPDSQIPEACAFEHAAFASDPLGASIFPGPFDENSAQHKIDSLMKARKEDSAIRYLAAYDGESGRIVAFSKWYLYETDEAAKNSARPKRDYGPGSSQVLRLRYQREVSFLSHQ
jgi:hypothetical protein